MYVLIVSRGYPTEKYKMNGIFEFDQAKALAGAGCKVVYAAIDVRSVRRWRKWGIEKKTVQGVIIYAINIPCGKIPKCILQRVSISALNILYRKIIKEQGKPDIVHAHFTSVGYIVSRLKNKMNIPFVMTEHSSSIMKPKIDRRLFNIANKAYKSADALIVVSLALKKIIKKRFGKDTIYIPNIVDTELFNYSRKQKDEIFRFISIGRLVALKRMDLTIEAFAKAFRNNDKVSLTIFGEGPERAKLENMIEAYNIGHKVKLMGLQSRKQIAESLKNSDCFVLASQAETFGVVYMEALACGVPVIATKCGGPEAFINEENGLLVNVDDLPSLTEAIIYMYENINKFDREYIAHQTWLRFSPEIIVKRLIEAYKKLKLGLEQ